MTVLDTYAAAGGDEPLPPPPRPTTMRNLLGAIVAAATFIGATQWQAFKVPEGSGGHRLLFLGSLTE